ncbi:AAA family ATPase [Ligilactobacillus ceti]|uniref:Nuclease SbcCD subunit C n=1 Tax=Ligilactobacillus ceti DSM 22408 TaxID=1122146 RepID=A0A0R2KIP1_9LACO|nr:SMC family ATPase [Ligilactobacillus ceti]KRN89266.1 exonuclease [Ligilactobacillus ceti DSM 22408]
MKPISLKIVNFGPFKDEFIDFTRFYEQSLFLITGPTGCGKTTIFDAMSFALFGTTSGGERSPETMRSDFAGPKDKTYVEFVFEHQGVEYTIYRSPKYQLAHKKTAEKQTVCLSYQHHGEMVTIEKVPEAGVKIHELLHLTAKQFLQIILLPQTKFQQFLLSNSNEKEAILRELFDSSLYQKWVDDLQLKLKGQEGNFAQVEQQIQNLQAQIEGVEDKELPPVQARSEWLKVVNGLLTAQKELLKDHQTSLQQLQKQQTQLTQQVTQEESLQANFEKLILIEKEQAKLAEKTEQMAQLALQVADLQWVQKQQVAINTYQQAQQQTDTLKNTLKELQTEARNIEQNAELLKEQEQELTNQKEEMVFLKQEVTLLAAKEPSYQQVDKLSKLYQQQNNRLTQEQEILTTENTRLAELEEAQTEYLKQQSIQSEKLTQQQIRLQEITEKRQATSKLYEKWESTLVKKNSLQKQQKQREQELRELSQQLSEQKEALQVVNDNWLQQQIVSLASQLSDNAPCPVCGSTEHPCLAQPTNNEQVSEQDVTTLQEICQQLTEQQVALEAVFTSEARRFQDYQEQEQNLVDKLGECYQIVTPVMSERIQQAYQDEGQQQTTYQQAEQVTKELLIEIQQQLEQVMQDKQQAEADVKQRTDVVQNLNQEMLQTKGHLAALQSELPAEYGDLASLQKAIRSKEQQLQVYEQKVEEYQKAEKHNTELQISNETQQNKLKEEQITVANTLETMHTKLENEIDAQKRINDIAMLLTLSQNVVQLEKLSVELTSYQQAVHDAEKQQQIYQELIAGKVKPDIAKTKSVLSQIEDSVKQQQDITNQQSNLILNNEKILAKIVMLEEQNQADELQLRKLKQLVDAVKGRNSDVRLGLEKYVLQQSFEKVLEIASLQLKRLSQGRYWFVLDKTMRKKTTLTGLEINVYDDNFGKERSVKTLSGGESFKAALALALALGEVIQAENGGVMIEALFIDEGFGSLDQDSLQLALETLQTLQASQRLVGVISHVEELKEQIPAQIQITTKDGRSQIGYQLEF